MRFRVIDANGETNLMYVENEDATLWKEGFNDYKGYFTVTEEWTNAKSASFLIMGPKPEADILFDKLVIAPYHPILSTCDEVRYFCAFILFSNHGLKFHIFNFVSLILYLVDL